MSSRARKLTTAAASAKKPARLVLPADSDEEDEEKQPIAAAPIAPFFDDVDCCVGSIIECGLAVTQQKFGLAKTQPRRFFMFASEDGATAFSMTPATEAQEDQLSAFGPVCALCSTCCSFMCLTAVCSPCIRRLCYAWRRWSEMHSVLRATSASRPARTPSGTSRPPFMPCYTAGYATGCLPCPHPGLTS
jgi:hypothetical protein